MDPAAGGGTTSGQSMSTGVSLFAEPIETARQRLNIAKPMRYAAAQQRLRQSREATFAMGTPV